MKQLLITLITSLSLHANLNAQTTIAFTYDAAGNMIQRQVLVIPPIPNGGARFANTPKDSSEIAPPLNFKIYPNPAQTYVNIEGELPKEVSEAKWQLLSSTGQVLKTGTYNGTLQSVSVQDLKSGLYMLEILYNKKQRSTYKIVVSN